MNGCRDALQDLHMRFATFARCESRHSGRPSICPSLIDRVKMRVATLDNAFLEEDEDSDGTLESLASLNHPTPAEPLAGCFAGAISILINVSVQVT